MILENLAILILSLPEWPLSFWFGIVLAVVSISIGEFLRRRTIQSGGHPTGVNVALTVFISGQVIILVIGFVLFLLIAAMYPADSNAGFVFISSIEQTITLPILTVAALLWGTVAHYRS